MDSLEALVEKASKWIEIDPQPETVSYIRDCISKSDKVALWKMFGSRVAFGTAGLRSKMAPVSCKISSHLYVFAYFPTGVSNVCARAGSS